MRTWFWDPIWDLPPDTQLDSKWHTHTILRFMTVTIFHPVRALGYCYYSYRTSHLYNKTRYIAIFRIFPLRVHFLLVSLVAVHCCLKRVGFSRLCWPQPRWHRPLPPDIHPKRYRFSPRANTTNARRRALQFGPINVQVLLLLLSSCR